MSRDEKKRCHHRYYNIIIRFTWYSYNDHIRIFDTRFIILEIRLLSIKDVKRRAIIDMYLNQMLSSMYVHHELIYICIFQIMINSILIKTCSSNGLNSKLLSRSSWMIKCRYIIEYVPVDQWKYMENLMRDDYSEIACHVTSKIII